MPTLNENTEENTTLELICSEYNQKELDEYLRYIDENLSNSLTEIIFTGCSEDPTNQWKNVFTKVEKVRLKSIEISTTGSVNVHHFFPNMRVLQSNVLAYADLSFIEYNFPHLEKLFFISNTVNDEIMDFLGSILPLNPQIKSIFLFDQFDQKVLHLINEFVPNLQELHLFGNSYDFGEPQTENPVQFKYVRKFTFDWEAYGIPTNFFFAFDQLEEIDFYVKMLEEKWIDWINQNNQLKRLSMPWVRADYLTWSNFAKQLPNLVEVSGVLWTQLKDNQVAGLLNEENKLRKVTIHLNTARECEKLMHHSHPGWNIVDEDQCESNKFMTFVR